MTTEQTLIDAQKDGRRLACHPDFTRSDLDTYALRHFNTADERIALITAFLTEKRRICPEWFAIGSEEWARHHASQDRHYTAIERDGVWFVWDSVSDHRVEFDD